MVRRFLLLRKGALPCIGRRAQGAYVALDFLPAAVLVALQRIGDVHLVGKHCRLRAHAEGDAAQHGFVLPELKLQMRAARPAGAAGLELRAARVKHRRGMIHPVGLELRKLVEQGNVRVLEIQGKVVRLRGHEYFGIGGGYGLFQPLAEGRISVFGQGDARGHRMAAVLHQQIIAAL